MNTTIPDEAALKKNQSDGGTWFHRVDFVFADTTEVNFCNDQAEFVYDGTTYIRIPFTLSPLTGSVDGALPTRVMSVEGPAVDTFLKPYIREKGGVGNATVTITKVLAEEPALDWSSEEEVYKASHHTKADDAIAVHLDYPRMREQQFPLESYDCIKCRVNDRFKGTLCGAASGSDCDGSDTACRGHSNITKRSCEKGLKPRTLKLA